MELAIAATGARFPQLARCTVADFQDGRLTVPSSRKGTGSNPPRLAVPIGADVVAVLRQATTGRNGNEPLFLRPFWTRNRKLLPDRGPWKTRASCWIPETKRRRLRASIRRLFLIVSATRRSCGALMPWGHKKLSLRTSSKRGPDYALALKGNQSSRRDDARLFFAGPACTAACASENDIDTGYGRIEERLCRAADAGWLAGRHPEWKGLRSLAAITAMRIDKTFGAETSETRLHVPSLEPDLETLLESARAL